MQSHTITNLLHRWNAQDSGAWDELILNVHQAIKQKANFLLGKQVQNQTLQPTVLLNELYLEFKSLKQVSWQNRQHFFAIAALAMRQIIVDRARHNNAEKRGGKHVFVTTNVSLAAEENSDIVDLLALDRALSELEVTNIECCQVVELRYFAGLTVTEVAEALAISERKVYYHWNWAKAWLHKRLYND